MVRYPELFCKKECKKPESRFVLQFNLLAHISKWHSMLHIRMFSSHEHNRRSVLPSVGQAVTSHFALTVRDVDRHNMNVFRRYI